MGVAEDARSTQERAIRRSDKAANVSLRLWRQVDPSDIDGSWDVVGPRIADTATSAALANATAAGQLTERVARVDGVRGDALVPQAFAGVDGSGRSLLGLLHGAVTTTKEAIRSGLSLSDAMVTGGSYMTVMLKTAIADIERSASMAAATGKGYVKYVRLVNPGACSRCAILAGSDRFSTNFRRHPACKCSTVPVRDNDFPEGLHATPGEYFDSLPASEQERVFTKAGAEAIRLGADPIGVVSARRGMNTVRRDGTYSLKQSNLQRSLIGRNPDGTPIYGYVTVEGTTRRGSFGRTQERLGSTTRKGGRYSSVTRPRLMPESIIGLTENVDTRRLLLRDAGYLRASQNYSNPNWLQERYAQEARDRATADAFYRANGIFTG